MTASFTGRTEDIEGGTFYDRSFDTEFASSVSEDAVAKSPAWHRADPNPPLSARIALRIADEFRKAKLLDRNNWKWGLESISLLPLRGRSNKWCWSVVFAASPESGGTSGAPEVRVLVLMNGEVIVPRESEYDGLKEWGIMAPDEADTTSKP